ncbi:MAG: hypothetical protein AMXMBFR67_21700 [Nitrospira sp.]
MHGNPPVPPQASALLPEAETGQEWLEQQESFPCGQAEQLLVNEL